MTKEITSTLIILAVFIALLFLSGCTTSSGKQQVRTRTITWEQTAQARQICAVLTKDPGAYACAIWIPGESKCTIITVPDAEQWVLGHEMLHCYDQKKHEEEI
jgi:hypothetical protein